MKFIGSNNLCFMEGKMKKVLNVCFLFIFGIIMVGCAKTYDFNYDDIKQNNTSSTVLTTELTLDVVNNNIYDLLVFESNESENFVFVDKGTVKYMSFIFSIINSEIDQIKKKYSITDMIEFITLDIEKQRVYIVPTSANENNLKDVFVIDFDIDEVLLTIDSYDKDSLISYHEVLSSINTSSILNAVLKSENELMLFSFLSGLDTVSKIALLEGFAPSYSVSENEIDFRVVAFDHNGIHFYEDESIIDIEETVVEVH